MPLHVQRGSYMAALEKFATDRESLLGARAALRDPTVDLASIADFSGVDPDFERHLREDWYDVQPDPTGPTQEPFVAGHRTTGFWTGYHGNVHEIVRQTLLTGIDVALRIPPGTSDADVAAVASHDPRSVMLLWICPSPFFGGYVSWIPDHVTVVFHTPANGDPVDSVYQEDTLDPAAGNGHVVVIHEEHRWWREMLTIGTPVGQIRLPFAQGVRGTGSVVRQPVGTAGGGMDPSGGQPMTVGADTEGRNGSEQP